MLYRSFQAVQIASFPKTSMPINVSPKVMAPRVFETQFLLKAPWVVLEFAAGSSGTDPGGSFWLCNRSTDVSPGLDSFDKAGSSCLTPVGVPFVAMVANPEHWSVLYERQIVRRALCCIYVKYANLLSEALPHSLAALLLAHGCLSTRSCEAKDFSCRFFCAPIAAHPTIL